MDVFSGDFNIWDGCVVVASLHTVSVSRQNVAVFIPAVYSYVVSRSLNSKPRNQNSRVSRVTAFM